MWNLLQRVIGIDVRSLVADQSMIAVIQYSSAAALLFINILLAKYLPRDTFGLYVFVMALVATASAFGLPGSKKALILDVAKHGVADLKGLLGHTFKLSLGPAVFFGISAALVRDVRPELMPILLILMVAVPISNTFSIGITLLMARQQYRLLLLVNTFKHIFLVAGMILLLFLYPEIWALVSFFLFATALPDIILLLINWKKSKPHPQTIRYAYFLSLILGLGIISGYVDRILVGALFGLSALGAYVFASMVYKQLISLSKSMVLALYPRMVHVERHQLYRLARRQIPLMVAGGVIVVAALYFAIPWGMELVFQNKYSDSIPYIRALLFAAVPVMVADILYSVLEAGRDQKGQARITLLREGVALVTLPVFALVLGIWGVIVSRILADTVYLGAVALHLRH